VPVLSRKLYIVVAACSIAVNIILLYSFRREIYHFFRPDKKLSLATPAASGLDTNYSAYFSYDSVGSIAFVPITPTAQALPGQLITKPGIYKAGDQCAVLDRQGLYRFVQADLTVQHRIVYQDDLKSLLSAICWIHTHGFTDNKLDNAGRNKESMKGTHYSSLMATMMRTA
jgi:hypothetical protein